MSKYTAEEVQAAFNVIKQAMVDDNPSEQGSYAHAWHCLVSTSVYDELPDHIRSTSRSRIGNGVATRFMKICFDVDTKQ